MEKVNINEKILKRAPNCDKSTFSFLVFSVFFSFWGDAKLE